MPMSMVGVGERARVMAISGPDAVRRHLGSLGFVPGVVVSVVQVLCGNLIVGLQDSRIALNGDLARRIMVEMA